MPSGAQNVGLLERRIIELLTTTSLTFKEIILKLDCENLSASIGIIRRINRDNRYRRPRYDSKLTPAQRESLVSELRNHQGVKPNLSLLAKRYGVCHGSVWYWWDKLNRKRCDSHSHSRSSFKPAKVGHLFKRSHLHHHLHHHHQHQLERHYYHHKTGVFKVFKQRAVTNSSSSSGGGGGGGNHLHPHPHPHQHHLAGVGPPNLVGRVSIVTSDAMKLFEMPILMFGSSARQSEWPKKVAAAAAAGEPEPNSLIRTTELLANPHLAATFGASKVFDLERPEAMEAAAPPPLPVAPSIKVED